MTFDVNRVLNRKVAIRDRTGEVYAGIVKEVHLDMFVLVNGDGTTMFISRSGANVVSIRVFP
jgi:hypothetical protein